MVGKPAASVQPRGRHRGHGLARCHRIRDRRERQIGHPSPWQPVVAYAVAANVCYSLGPIADVYILKRWGPAYAAVGATLFRYGFVFAVGLTLLPLPLAMASIVLRVLRFI